MSKSVSSNECLDSKRPVRTEHTGFYDSTLLKQSMPHDDSWCKKPKANKRSPVDEILALERSCLCLMANEEQPLVPASTPRFTWRFLLEFLDLSFSQTDGKHVKRCRCRAQFFRHIEHAH